ncbi:B12-binding domain-containing radical SAM protein [Candidatus Omnitrophota bacterium]
MKALLLSPPYLKDYMRNARCDFVSLSGTQWFPILLGYLGVFLEGRGVEVKFVDAPAYNLSKKDVEDIYLEYSPDFLIVYPGDKSRDSDIEFGDLLLCKHKIPAIFVGPYFSMEPDYFLSKSQNILFGALGEFEYPVWDLIKGESPKDINNLARKEGSEIIKNSIRPYLTQPELDKIPFVSEFFNRHLDFKYYHTPSEPHPFVDIMTGRGCKWGMCTFCLWAHTYIRGCTYNTRSINSVLNELEYIEESMSSVRSIMIQDDTLPKDRIEEFCKEKLNRGIKIRWSCYLRADIDYETLKLMKQAGCLNIHVGFESANNEVMKQIKKGLTKDRMTQFALDAKKAGLKIHGDFLIGLPGDNEESIRDMINWACTIRPYTAQFQVFIPFKGTAIYEEMNREGLIKDARVYYPDLSNERIEYLSKLAYRKFYISLPYFLEVIKHPIDLFFKKTRTICRSLPSILWKKMDIR